MIDGIIIKGIGGLYSVKTEKGLYTCNVRGIFRKRNISPLVGDFVEISITDKLEKTGIIDVIKERKTELIRPRISNVDQVIIVFAIKNPDINLNLLDRFIILAEKSNINVVICINKIDIDNKKDYIKIKDIYEKIGYKVLLTSPKENIGILELKETLQNKISVFAGPSGAGKSSLVNLIKPDIKMEVGEISKKIKRGKHTTRHAQIRELSDSTYIADSPGFTSLYFKDIPKNELQYYFREFRHYLGKCQFNNCNHINEPNCFIKENIDNINITQRRYDRYVEFFNEIE